MLLLSPCVFLALSWAQAPSRRLTPRPPLGAQTSEYKAVFEPVNYGQDINLTDIFFASADEGWVSGEHATILKTTDGGAHWTAQAGGDPNSNDKPIGLLRFLDARHGWAVNGDQRLLRTMDGENWEQIGQQPEPGVNFLDYAFTSVRHGIALGSNMGGFYVTNDGGRHWQNVARCKLTANVQGLPRSEDCRVNKLQMLSARDGYARVDWSQGIAFMRTDDGGERWSAIVPDVSDCCGPDFFFTDLNRGVLLYNNGKTYLTTDGAKTWHALLSGTVGLTSAEQTPPLRFADPEVGWVLGVSPDNSDTLRVSFSSDGGQHWKMSRNIAFPSGRTQLKFNFPRRDRAYVIGPHGMIYRYRIVPGSYNAAKTLDAPMMPVFGAAALSAKADAIRQDIQTIQSKLAAVSGGATSGTATAGIAAAANTTQNPGAANTSGDAGGFVQQTDIATAGNGVPAQPADAAAGSSDLGSAIAQDISPPSDAVANCCAAAVQQLQADTAGFVVQVPQVTSQYRPLNLIIAGLQLATTLMNQGKTMWTQFKTLKHAPSIPAAMAALQQLSTTLNTVQQASSTGLQNPGAWFATNAPAAFTQDVGAGATGGAAAPGGFTQDVSTPGNASPGSAPQNGAAPASPPQ